MTIHFFRQMEGLHKDLLSMCSTVEQLINDAVEGLRNRRRDLAVEIADRDSEVDAWDIRVEEECLKILALYHPVANDLRRVTSVLKITGELERVADLAVNIAERSDGIAAVPEFPMPDRLGEMASEALSMLHASLDAYVDLNAELARSVCLRDDGVDEFNTELIREIQDVMIRQPEMIVPGMHMFSAVRHIERVADHATNIAEDVVYLVQGAIIRHPGVVREKIQQSG